MPRKPVPIKLEVVDNNDSETSQTAEKEVLKLLIRFTLEDRGAQIPDSIEDLV